MKPHGRARIGVAALLIGAASPGAHARVDTEALEARVTRLETQTAVDLLTRLERLQNEVQQMRGQLEEQTHALESMQQRQRDLYLDLDRRLRQLEQGGMPPAPGASFTPSGDAPAPTDGTVPPDTASPPGTASIEPTPPGSAPAVPPAADPQAEQAAYQQAFGLLKDARYTDAANAFRNYLATYPGGRLADNAQYWLGEAYYVSRGYKQALEEFGKVVEQYPRSPKVPDALLKIGYIHYEQSRWAEARQSLAEVTTRYPDSSAARLAQDRLQRMSKEGR